MEQLQNENITCIFCGVDTATWRRDFRTSQITVTVPICKRCSELPEHILIEQLKPVEPRGSAMKSKTEQKIEGIINTAFYGFMVFLGGIICGYAWCYKALTG